MQLKFDPGSKVTGIAPSGKHKGSHFGVIAVRSTGSFCLKTKTEKVDGINAKILFLSTKSFRICFFLWEKAIALPPPAKARGIRALGVL